MFAEGEINLYDSHWQWSNSSLTNFAIFISAMKGEEQLEDTIVKRIYASTDSVLKGSDPVLSLMDKRVRDIFKTACSFDFGIDRNGNAAPQSMRTGVQSQGQNVPLEESTQKAKFVRDITREAIKLGFNVVVDEIIEASYDAYKVIKHCMKVHQHHVFFPIASEIVGDNENSNSQ